ncbi:MAG: cupin domain-containing protein [Halolamina sp.]|uniref:cupin domain-containing protein n=1 Tax=Halolamina sp. TaxID=1940283 RepID=UPI002FC3C569
MGYHHVDPATVDPTPDRPSVQRAISETLGLENVAVNRYEAEPGEAIPLAYHYHDDQEEVFYVLAGTLVVETPGERYEVGADEVFAVEPGSPQYASAAEDVRGSKAPAGQPEADASGDADRTTEVLAIGAPRVDDVHAYEEGDG